MSRHLTFEIELLSDYHVGAGHGLGPLVDSALFRDADGIPSLRGTVLTGLLRASLMELLQLQPLRASHAGRCKASHPDDPAAPLYCGAFGVGEGRECPICAILGTPRHAKRWRVSSARPVGLQSPSKVRWQPGREASLVTTRVRVSPATRRAEENKLFAREEGDGRLRFRFGVECLDDAPDVEAQAALLVAAARHIRRLGAGRRRGRGECRVHLVADSQFAAADSETAESHLLAVFERVWLLRQPLDQRATAAQATASRALPAATPGAAAPYRLRLVVRADEPLLLARRAEAGNEFDTLQTIPGAALRGALAHRVARRQGGLAEGEAAYAEFVALFFRGGVRCSMLLPAKRDEDGLYPTVPLPLDATTCSLYPGFNKAQGGAGHGVWFQVWDQTSPDECPVCRPPETRANGDTRGEVKIETLRGWLPLQENVGLHQPGQRAEMHIEIDPTAARVAAGRLYSYTLLDAGQYFVGELVCATEATWQRLRELASLPEVGQVFELRLGKAARRGYGRVSVSLSQPRMSDVSPWVALPIAQRVMPNRPLVMTLLTDAVITDRWGRYQEGFADDWLARELGLPVTLDAPATPAGRPVAYNTARVVDSFNSQLGLPRTREVALAAGSTVCLKLGPALDKVTLDRLAQVERDGIGLRRDEGFGVVAFNHPVYTGRQGLTNATYMDLDRLDLDLDESAGDNPLAKLAKFAQDWGRELARDRWRWSRYRDGRFEAVARLLHTSGATSLTASREVVRSLGRPEALLDEALPGRSKKPFVEEEEAKPAVTQLDALLTRLDEMIQDHAPGDVPDASQMWRLGLEALADRIAVEARAAAEAEE